MAFGKDRSGLNANFRQRAKRSTTRAPKTKGSAPLFINRYQPPLGVSSDTVRLLAGEYTSPVITSNGEYELDDAGQQLVETMPYWKYILHYQKQGGRQRSCVCSAGPLVDFKGKSDPCNGCDHFWGEWEKRKATNSDHPKSMSKRDMWVFTVLVMAPFFKAADVDENGIQKTGKDGKPYWHWEKCDARGASSEESLIAAGHETKQGHIMHWSMGLSHFNTMLDWSLAIGNHCRICNGEDCVKSLAWVCQNPECGEAVVDMESTTLSDEEIDKLTSFATVCPHCKLSAFLSEVYECTNCKQGDRATLFDVDLTVKRVEASDGGNQNSLQAVRISAPGPISSTYSEVVCKPLDLPKIFGPTDMKKQIELFGAAPPRAGAVGTGGDGADMQRTPVTTGGSRAYSG